MRIKGYLMLDHLKEIGFSNVFLMSIKTIKNVGILTALIFPGNFTVKKTLTVRII